MSPTPPPAPDTTTPIWIVDDDPSIRFVLEKALAREQFVVRSFSNSRDVLAALGVALQAAGGDPPAVLVSDIRMPGSSGIDLLAQVKAKMPGLPVIIMTAFSDLDSAVSAFQGGAFEYLPKPFDVTHAVELIRRAVQERQREAVNEGAQTVMPEMLGQAPAMQDVFRAIGRLSQSNVTVLITGESGSGKELVARALHKHSPRSEGPMVSINTAAIPKDLLESELFGHERGAFTGAQTTRRGRFEQAEGGTLFLDEIGHLALPLQGKILRALEERVIRRVGGTRAIPFEVRLIAATHVDLASAVRRGEFREDLYYRLNVVPIELPALRARHDDVLTIASYFLARFAREYDLAPFTLSPAAVRALRDRRWPGNVRELRNAIERAVLLSNGSVLEASDIAEPLRDDRVSDSLPFPSTLADLNRAAVARMLDLCGGNKTEAARRLGISRPRLHRLLSASSADVDDDGTDDALNATRHTSTPR